LLSAAWLQAQSFISKLNIPGNIAGVDKLLYLCKNYALIAKAEHLNALLTISVILAMIVN